jgi:acylphosphatase
MANARIHVLIKGVVHGVTFRYNTVMRARAMGLTGWVKNIPDAVELIAEGPKPELERLIEWCHKGPSCAKVCNVGVKWEKATNEFEKFGIR